MVHHVYREKKGCLVRFSLLPGGAVKKAQALGGKLRLMAFDRVDTLGMSPASLREDGRVHERKDSLPKESR